MKSNWHRDLQPSKTIVEVVAQGLSSVRDLCPIWAGPDNVGSWLATHTTGEHSHVASTDADILQMIQH